MAEARRLDKGSSPLLDRLRRALLKPGDSDAEPAGPTTTPNADELRAALRSADDKERLIGLIAAPFAAAIAILVVGALVSHDPTALLKDGQVNKLHVGVSLYETLLVSLLVLSVLMLVTAMLRKRLFLGITTALYGLAVFNLHYWGFGVPFVLVGAWLLVRAYRFQRDLKLATADEGSAWSGSPRPRANKRYTPPAAARGR